MPLVTQLVGAGGATRGEVEIGQSSWIGQGLDGSQFQGVGAEDRSRRERPPGGAIRAVRRNDFRQQDARHVMVVATHAVFVEGALRRLAAAKPDEVVVTDTIPLRNDLDRAGLKGIQKYDFLDEQFFVVYSRK